MALLSVENISVDYRTGGRPLHALRNVSLTAARGEAIGIVGESGCGKSTLSLAIPGLLPTAAAMTSGRIVFDGASLDGGRQSALRGRDIAMVFQDPMTAFNPVLTIGEQLVDFAARRGGSKRERRAKAIGLLGRTGISAPEQRFDAYPHELSGGMRQRAAIAAALMVEPSLLIADEPTTALDVTTEAQIIELFRELRQDFGGAIIVVTHHLGVVAQLCDRVYVLYAGEAVEEGPVERIFNAPEHPYTKALLACDPARIAGGVKPLPVIAGRLPDLRDPPRGCSFAPRCGRRTEACETRGAVRIELAWGHTVLCREARP